MPPAAAAAAVDFFPILFFFYRRSYGVFFNTHEFYILPAIYSYPHGPRSPFTCDIAKGRLFHLARTVQIILMEQTLVTGSANCRIPNQETTICAFESVNGERSPVFNDSGQWSPSQREPPKGGTTTREMLSPCSTSTRVGCFAESTGVCKGVEMRCHAKEPVFDLQVPASFFSIFFSSFLKEDFERLRCTKTPKFLHN